MFKRINKEKFKSKAICGTEQYVTSICFLWFSVYWRRRQGGKADNSELNTEYQDADFKHTALEARQGPQEDSHVAVAVSERSLGGRRDGR